MFPGANNEAVRTCRCHTLLARPNRLDLADVEPRILGLDLFCSKAADPVDSVNQGDPKTSQIYKFLKGYQNGNKFVDIDILGQHSSIKWVWWRLFYLFRVLQTNESINCPEVPTLATFKKTNWCFIIPYFNHPVLWKHLQFRVPKNSSWPQLSVFSSPGYVSTDLRLKEVCRPEWHPPRASQWFGDILGSHCGTWDPSSRAEWWNDLTRRMLQKDKNVDPQIIKIPQKYSTGKSLN